jgi:transposase
MRKILDILRLHFSGGLSNQAIADALRISKGSVFNCLKRFEAAGLTWPLPADLSQGALKAKLYPSKASPAKLLSPSELDRFLSELKRPHVTRRLLFKEYRVENPAGPGRSQFYAQLARHAEESRVSLHMDHAGGDKLFVDYSGDKPSYLDLETGEVVPVELFVATWGASSYCYAEVTRTQSALDFVQSHVRAFRFFDCVPKALVPDNLKAAVLKASFFDPDLNPLCNRMAAHYDTVLLPARVRKPKDKAVVESNILHLQRYILGALRDRLFFSFAEVSEAVHALLVQFNEEPMQIYKVSRRVRFESMDKPYALPLPEAPFALMDLKMGVTVHADYHIQYRKHFYSVPYTLVGRKVEVHADGTTIQVYLDGERVASHLQGAENFRYSTLEVHMPPNHRFWKGLSPDKLIATATSIGEAMTTLIGKVLDRKKHPEQGYRAALGLLDLAKRFGNARLNAAAARALHYGATRRRDLLAILEKGLDQKPIPEMGAQAPLFPAPPLEHANIRGGASFKPNSKEIFHAYRTDPEPATHSATVPHGQVHGGAHE